MAPASRASTGLGLEGGSPPPCGSQRPVIGGGFNPNVSAPEEFLVNQPIVFNITACDNTDVMQSVESTETFNIIQVLARQGCAKSGWC
jgi:hypothetical protein